MVIFTKPVIVYDIKKYIGEYTTYCFDKNGEYVCSYLAIIGEGYIFVEPKYEYVIPTLTEIVKNKVMNTYGNIKLNDYFRFHTYIERSDYSSHITVYVLVAFYDVHNYNDFNRLYDYLLKTFDDVIRESVELINNYITSNPTSNS